MKKFILCMALGMQFFLLPSVFCGCAFSGFEEVCFEVPENSRVLTLDDSGAVAEFFVSSLQKGGGGQGLVSVRAQKNAVVPILAYGENSSIPQGTIYPFCTEANEEDAFAACVLMGLYAGAMADQEQDFCQVQEYLSRFNWSRFMKECRTLENPWALDKEAIMEDIAGKCFTKRDLQ